MIPGVVASETGSAQTFYIFTCNLLRVNKFLDEYVFGVVRLHKTRSES
jgi:hypothetical protein